MNIFYIILLNLLILKNGVFMDIGPSQAFLRIIENYGNNGSLNFSGFQLLINDLKNKFNVDFEKNVLHENLQCLNASTILESHQHDVSKKIGSSDFESICPTIIDQIILPECRGSEDHEDHDHKSYGEKLHDFAMWGYTFIACLIISFVGLLAVAIIPIMHKVIYNHALQFLVALAIGSLTGDALLHLLPHAIRPHDSHVHGLEDILEKRSIFLGLTALIGIFIFFLIERLVGICSESKRQANESKQKMNSSSTSTSPMMNAMFSKKNSQKEDETSCDGMLMMVHTSKDVRKLADNVQNEVHRHCEAGHGDGEWIQPSHGHHHHSHDAHGSIASVAWMVIVGDGFHNLADGIAIGSAFASGFQDGLSTSIAVFCHELPHELGDFAMLLSAGMSAKQALIYNCVSSLLCFCGAFIGVAIGNLSAATPWVFAFVAGLFLYIALVDMLPEMKAVIPRRHEHPCLHLSLQLGGMFCGATIMLLIALFEDRIALIGQ